MSRLVDHGPDRIEWLPVVETVDEYGTPVHSPSSTPIVFTAQVQRSTSEDEARLGQDVTDAYSFRTSRALEDTHSGLVVNGRACDVIRPPQQQGRSPRTFTTTVYFRYLDEE